MQKQKSKEKPFFSVIIPAYNEEKYLPLLLESISDQSYRNFEVLIIDGKSEDGTIQVAKKFKKKIFNLKIIMSQKRNVSYQRNLGAKKAKGKYYIFIDADTTFNKNAFFKTYQQIDKKKLKIFYPQISFSSPSSPKFIYQLLSWISNLFFSITAILKINAAVGQYLVIEKGLFKQIKGYNDRLALSEEHNLIKKARNYNYHHKFIKNFTVFISPRRIEKEGLIKFLIKYLYFIIHEFIYGPSYYKPPLSYPMGGKHYE